MPRYKIMPEIVAEIKQNLEIVRNGIEEAARKRGIASAQKPLLVAVSKTKSLAAIKKAYDAGQRDFGENYLRELVLKSNNPDMSQLCPDIKWHYIGAYQKKQASTLMRVKNLHMIQTLSDIITANTVNTRWPEEKEPLLVMVQINTSGEESKSGAKPEDCLSIVKHIIDNCPRLKLSGLMTIGAFGHDYSSGPNPDFVCLKECHSKVCKELNIKEEELGLSMGMSNDYTQAIEAGSTLVRVGSSIFGARE
uniref:Pyridoxal phosphate homeostasis protein n=1 Tax=Phallusia mammillata TaxID=59560 RepID=A0A6F9DP10_9ASCI|nr:proline synthase co-transcribed bacterial homolog protein-like [Phallusia mammillata]